MNIPLRRGVRVRDCSVRAGGKIDGANKCGAQADVLVLATSVLGGLHHEYSLETAPASA
jgi:hypothetical protein